MKALLFLCLLTWVGGGLCKGSSSKRHPPSNAAASKLNQEEHQKEESEAHWTELGCFIDNEDRVLKNKLGTDTETVDTCSKLAREGGYSMIGLEWGGECWADNDFQNTTSINAEPSECSTPCQADEKQICGNNYRLSVYVLSEGGVESKPKKKESSSPKGDDPCGKLVDSPSKVFGVADAFACYNSFSLFPEVRKGQIDTLKNFLNFYAFLDITKSSATPYFSSNIDIFEQLDFILNDNSITTEFAFHSKISALFRSLNDPHTTYESSCFANVRFYQPWALAASYKSSKTPEIYILGISTKISPAFAGAGELKKEVEKFWKDSGLELEKYEGYKVVKVDGKDVISAIQERADKNGGSRVPETRFNLQLVSQIYAKGGFGVNDGAFYIVTSPESNMPDSIQYDLVSPDGKDSVSLKAPWAAFVMPSAREVFTDRETLYQKACINSWSEVQQGTPPPPPAAGDVNYAPHRKPSQFGLKHVVEGEVKKKDVIADEEAYLYDLGYGATSPENQLLLSSLKLRSRLAAAKLKAKEKGSNPATRPNLINPHVDWKHASKQSIRLQYAAAKRLKGMIKPNGMLQPFDIRKPIVSDDNMAFYMIDDRTGVWSFPTVSPAATDDEALANWMATFASGMSALEKAGAEFLLIDVSNNGGGIVCAGAAFAQYLLPSIRFLAYDIRLSKAAESLLLYASGHKEIVSNSSTFATFDVLSSPDRTPFQGQDLISKGPSYSRGRTLTPYTQKFENDCTEYTTGTFKNLPQLTKGWTPDKMAIVSNGFCGSTCSNFVRVLREQYSIRSFVYGGGSGQVFQPTSFEGGRLLSFDDLLLDSNEILWNASMDNGTVIRGLRMNPSVANNTNTNEVPQLIHLFKRKDSKKTKKSDHTDKKKTEDHKSKEKTKNSKSQKKTSKKDVKKPNGGKSHIVDYAFNNAKIIEKMVPILDEVTNQASDGQVAPRKASEFSAKVLDASVELPREFPRPISGSLAFWECYAVFGPVTGMPLEWVPAPAEELLTISDPNKVEDIWRSVATRLYANASAPAGTAVPVQPVALKEVTGGETADASKRNGESSLASPAWTITITAAVALTALGVFC
ncbi:hypothetical protein HDU67_002196 [Dinochytrium kinnereticum]|nr:hypothetical protein HDU67_002196 [Dinochytrium kinnereticum]